MNPKEQLSEAFEAFRVDALRIFEDANPNNVDPKIPTKDTPIGTPCVFWDSDRAVNTEGFWGGEVPSSYESSHPLRRIFYKEDGYAYDSHKNAQIIED